MGGMPEVSDLGHGLLAEEAALGRVDEPFESGLLGQRVGPEIHAEPGDASPDPLGVERVGRDLRLVLRRSPTLGEDVRRQEVVPTGPRHRRFDRVDGRLTRLSPCREQVEEAAHIPEIDVGREHIRSQDRVDGLRLHWVLQQQQALAPRLEGRHAEVGLDSARPVEQQRPPALAGPDALDPVRHQVVQPGQRVRARHLDLAPGSQVDDRWFPVHDSLFHGSGRIAGPWSRSTSRGPCSSPTTTPRASAGSSGPWRTWSSSSRPTGWREHDAAQPYPIYRWPALLSPHPDLLRKVRSIARETGTEAVVFGASLPAGPIGPSLAKNDIPYLVGAHGVE